MAFDCAIELQVLGVVVAGTGEILGFIPLQLLSHRHKSIWSPMLNILRVIMPDPRPKITAILHSPRGSRHYHARTLALDQVVTHIIGRRTDVLLAVSASLLVSKITLWLQLTTNALIHVSPANTGSLLPRSRRVLVWLILGRTGIEIPRLMKLLILTDEAAGLPTAHALAPVRIVRARADLISRLLAHLIVQALLLGLGEGD